MNSKTFIPKEKDIKREWHTIDAEGKVLGRLATQIADILRGKNKVIFAPSVDCGDFVVVTSVEGIKLTGNKVKEKVAFRHSGYPGGDHYEVYEKLIVTNPEKVLRLAVKGMLSKNKIGSKQIKRLKIYKGKEHKHGAQLAASSK